MQLNEAIDEVVLDMAQAQIQPVAIAHRFLIPLAYLDAIQHQGGRPQADAVANVLYREGFQRFDAFEGGPHQDLFCVLKQMSFHAETMEHPTLHPRHHRELVTKYARLTPVERCIVDHYFTPVVEAMHTERGK